MTTFGGPYVPVAPVAPRGPKVTLIGSSVIPKAGDADVPDFEWDDDNPPVFTLGDEKITDARWPAALKAEIEARSDKEKWLRYGIAYLPMNQSTAHARAVNDLTSYDLPTQDDNPAIVQAAPVLFNVQASYSSFGFEALEYVQRATEHMEAAIFAALEAEFWKGTVAQASDYPNNFLANSADPNFHDLTPESGPVSITAGLSLLQSALRGGADSVDTFGGQGMIHCEPGVVPNLLYTRRQGQLLLDQFDNIIVPGAGYDGSAPVGTDLPDGASYIYATDLVVTRVMDGVVVLPETIADTLSRGQSSDYGYNTITYRAFKPGMAYFDGVRHFAVCVSLPS